LDFISDKDNRKAHPIEWMPPKNGRLSTRGGGFQEKKTDNSS